MCPLSSLSDSHLRSVAEHYEALPDTLGILGAWYRKMLGRRVAALVPSGSSILEVGCGAGHLLAALKGRDVTGVDLALSRISAARKRVPWGAFHVDAGERLHLGRTFDYILISDTINLAADVQKMLETAAEHAHEGTRLILSFQNHLWRPLVTFAEATGIKERTPTSNWLSIEDVRNLLRLTGWETVRTWQECLVPLPLGGIEALLNRWVTPLLEPLAAICLATARPCPRQLPLREASVSVVIPARNEAGNIEQAVLRTPGMGSRTEIIFVEGGSSDSTWEEIQRVKAKFPDRPIKALRQTGVGKGNAVREGFAEAQGDIVMILDADLTVPPEELPKFYQAIASGRAEFANGSRLVYPMEKRAMQFLNMCANKFFGLSFSWLLGQPLKDTLCGTKAMTRKDYERIAANRHLFGEFDPFGDFDLLFGASNLSLKIRDIPVRYRERVYGTTNIQRWRHGLLLFRMLAFAATRLRFVR
ncbi:MAG: glycosyltransferase [Opitutaceae bacterium]|nr:glycosyltransferase [Opitutaceae bacterium]